MADRLTEGQRRALVRVSDETGGIAGSRWYPSLWLGGVAVARSLNRMGFIAPDKDFGAGVNWRITPAGRRALQSGGDE